jgi:glycerol uptake facilitator-like aquaporin
MGTAMIYLLLIVLLHPISGAHLNPCVTVAQAIATQSKEYTFVSMVIVAQFMGGLCAMTMSMILRGVGANEV